MAISDTHVRPGWREEIHFFLGNLLIKVLLIMGVIIACILYPFGWVFKKCLAWLKSRRRMK